MMIIMTGQEAGTTNPGNNLNRIILIQETMMDKMIVMSGEATMVIHT